MQREVIYILISSLSWRATTRVRPWIYFSEHRDNTIDFFFFFLNRQYLNNWSSVKLYYYKKSSQLTVLSLAQFCAHYFSTKLLLQTSTINFRWMCITRTVRAVYHHIKLTSCVNTQYAFLVCIPQPHFS